MHFGAYGLGGLAEPVVFQLPGIGTQAARRSELGCVNKQHSKRQLR